MWRPQRPYSVPVCSLTSTPKRAAAGPHLTHATSAARKNPQFHFYSLDCICMAGCRLEFCTGQKAQDLYMGGMTGPRVLEAGLLGRFICPLGHFITLHEQVYTKFSSQLHISVLLYRNKHYLNTVLTLTGAGYNIYVWHPVLLEYPWSMAWLSVLHYTFI